MGTLTIIKFLVFTLPWTQILADPLIMELMTNAPKFPNSELSGILRQPIVGENITEIPNANFMGPNFRAIIDKANLCGGKPNGYNQCTTNCRGRIYCDNTAPHGIRTIQHCTGVTPYCSPDTYTCVAQNDRCIVKDPSITMCAQAFTNDLTDCRKYTYCKGDGYLYQYYCIYPFVFDIKTNTCANGIFCNNFSRTSLCNVGLNKLVPWPGNPSLFVLCSIPPVAYSCDTNYIFNAQVQSCAFQCPAAGRFPNIGDTTKITWYECIKSGLTITAFKRYCADGTTFDPSAGPGPNTGVCHF